MFLSQLNLTHFKNHPSLHLEFAKSINVFIGNNGVGKTNILDAIYYLAVFRSHIHHLDYQNIAHGEDFFRIDGRFGQDYHVVAKYTAKTKTIEINQSKISKYSEYFGHIPIVLSCPHDIFLLHEGSEERRKLLDYTISVYHKEYLYQLNQYNHYLEQRNALLKKEEPLDSTLIPYYDRFLSELGTAIYQERTTMMAQFQTMVMKWYRAIAQSDEKITTTYVSRLSESSMSEILQKNLEKDKILKRTSSGIHRDDIRIEMNGLDLKKQGSQGQQKSLLYALRIAQAEFISQQINQKTIFLLDDFSDKLDLHRKKHLLHQIESIDFVSQWFLSDTTDSHFSDSASCQIFQL